jgi:hypothetical protein
MSGYHSADGVTWTLFDENDRSTNADTPEVNNPSDWGAAAPDSVYVGLAVSGRTANPFSCAGDPGGGPSCSDRPSRVTYDEVELVLGDGAELVEAGGAVEIVWDIPRSALAAGVTYQVAGDEAEMVGFRGSLTVPNDLFQTATILGPDSASLCGGTTATGFRRGDANADGATNLADAVATFNFLFLGGDEPKCLDAADSNDTDNALNLTDGVFLLNFLFLGGDAIPDPGPFDCGLEPDGSPFTFECENYDACNVGG